MLPCTTSYISFVLDASELGCHYISPQDISICNLNLILICCWSGFSDLVCRIHLLSFSQPDFYLSCLFVFTLHSFSLKRSFCSSEIWLLIVITWKWAHQKSTGKSVLHCSIPNHHRMRKPYCGQFTR